MEEYKNKNTIHSIGRKGKVLDFNNGLVLADITDYGQLSGRGTHKHNPNAVIQLDLSTNGQKLKANVEPFYFELIKEIALKNLIGSAVTETGTSINSLNAAMYTNATVNALYTCISNALSGMISGCRAFQAGNSVQDSLAYMVSGLDAANSSLYQLAQIPPMQRVDKIVAYDWTPPPMTRVNRWKIDAAGLAPVKEITFARKKYDLNGKETKYPWYIKISNFQARPSDGDIGFMPGTQQDVASAFINITDLEMYETCYHISNFVRVWQDQLAGPLVKDGCRIKEEEALSWKESQTY